MPFLLPVIGTALHDSHEGIFRVPVHEVHLEAAHPDAMVMLVVRESSHLRNAARSAAASQPDRGYVRHMHKHTHRGWMAIWQGLGGDGSVEVVEQPPEAGAGVHRVLLKGAAAQG